MTERDLEAEIAELRKQVEELLAQRQAAAEPSAEEHEEAAPEGAPGDELGQLRGKLEQFLDLLQEDMREMPATSAVAIFALGILLGRLLKR